MQKGVVSYEEFQKMVRNAPPGSGINAKSIAASIERKGYKLAPELSSYSSIEPQEKTEGRDGFFEKLAKRNEAVTGSETGIVEAALNPSRTYQSDSSIGRLLRGEQGLGETVLQGLGQGAGTINDIGGAVLGIGGKAVSALTPETIKQPIKNMSVSLLNSPVGQAGLRALEGGMDMYNSWKEKHPVDAANIEAIVNIASIIPSGKATSVATKAVQKTGVDDALKAGSTAMRESAEASVSRVLNPTTQATKQTTQKIAGELVDRPLTETLSLTRKGMQGKAEAAAELAGEAIQQTGPLQGTSKTSGLIDYLQSQKQQFVAGGKVVNKAGVESIDEVTQLIAQYGDEVPDETLRDIRKIFDAEYYQGKKNIAKSAAETSQLNFKKQAADKIRSILAEAHPDVAVLNKEYNFWSNLEDVLEKTVARKTGQKQALKAIATIGGATTGNSVVGKALGAIGFNLVASLIDSPAWGFINAKIKNQLAEALAKADTSMVSKIISTIPQQAVFNTLPDTSAQ